MTCFVIIIRLRHFNRVSSIPTNSTGQSDVILLLLCIQPVTVESSYQVTVKYSVAINSYEKVFYFNS